MNTRDGMEPPGHKAKCEAQLGLQKSSFADGGLSLRLISDMFFSLLELAN